MDREKALNELKKKGLLRSLFTLPQVGGKFLYQGENFLNFSSNDYLNFSSHPQVKHASKRAIEKYGTGSTSSRLMCGHLEIHAQLEKKLANFMGYESALIFGSGFLTNLGVITALTCAGDFIFFDKLAHASLIDGVRLSNAKWKRFEHGDVKDLENLLKRYKNEIGQKFIIIDSVFSMDGDIAPVKKIYDLTKEYNAVLIVDEAHAIGIFGRNGSGYCNQENVKPDLITGTFSKSFGSYGGFVVCSSEIKKLLINKARSFIYSTALPPACMGGVLEALNIIEEKKNLGNDLLDKSRYFYDLLNNNGYDLLPFESQIIPIIIGENEKTITLANKLMREGIYTKAIRPPTVSNNTARIRLSITLAHDKEDLKYTANKICDASKQLDIL